MKRYLVYDKTTKELLRQGTCPDDQFEAQAVRDNEGVYDPRFAVKRTFVELLPTPDPLKEGVSHGS